MVPRTRFAPSPTGPPHVGSLHTALFSWALARSLGGDFVLRIEDSDESRTEPAAVEMMLEALQWLGIDWDEGPGVDGDHGPYMQSQRLDHHRRVAEELLDRGHAYYGDDALHPAIASGNPLRLRLSRPGQTVVADAIRGPITFDNEALSDPIIVRSDGRPLYHLAAMADDHLMAITHVVRGEEWLPSAPYHVQLYQLLDWQQPVWVHLPLIVDSKGRKLSKRDPQGGYLVADLQQAGYLPQAVWNYLLLLGWSPEDEQGMIDRWQVRKQFRLERLSASPAAFDWDKLKWMNRHYLEQLSDEALALLIQPYLEEAYDRLPAAAGWLERLAGAIRSDIRKLEDAVILAAWAFEDEFNYSEAARAALQGEAAQPVLVRLVAELASVVVLDEQTAQAILGGLRDGFATSHGWSPRQILTPLRAALTGEVDGPPLSQILSLIGKGRALQRLANALRS